MKPTKISGKEKMSNPIEEYFAESTQSKEVLTSKELFRANKDDIDVKTDLEIREIILVNKLLYNNDLLSKAGLDKVYDVFLNGYLRLKISLNRKSRTEFVDMNKGGGKNEDVLDTMSKISNITGVKK